MPLYGLRRPSGLVFLLLLLGSGGWVLLGPAPGELTSISQVKEALEEGDEVQMEGARIVETQEGKRSWEVEADLALVSEKGKYARLYKRERAVTLRLYTEGEALVCQADQGRVDLVSKDVSLSGNVVVRSSQGVELSTEALGWLAEKKRLHSDKRVRIIKRGLEIAGLGLEADPGLERLMVDSGVSSRFLGSRREVRGYGKR